MKISLQSVDTSLFMYNRSTFNISLEIPGNIKAPGESLFNVTISDKNLNLTVFENYDPWDGYGNEIEIINGKGTFSKYFWNMGQYEISIDFTGNEDYKPVHKSFTVFISNYTINVYNITYSPDANEIYFEVPDSFEYDFNVTMDGKPYTAKFDGEERGAHYIAVDDLTYGKHEANIYFEGKDQFHELNVTKTFYVKSEIGLTDSVIDWNTSGGFYIDLPADATGELVAYRYDYETKQCGERLGSVEITEGQGFLNLGNWSIGEYCLHVTYENGNYAVEPISTDVNVRPQITYSNYVFDKNNAKVKVNADGGNLTVYGNGGKQVGFVQVNGPTNISINMGNYNYFEIVYLKDNYEYRIDFEITVIDLSVNFNKSLPKFANGFRVYSDDSCHFDYYFDGNYKGEYDIDEYWQGYVNIPFDEGDLTLDEHTIELKFGDESKKITFTVFDANISVPTYFFKGQDSNLIIQMPEEMGGNVTGYLGTYDDWESDTITYSQFFSQNVTDEPIIVSLDDLKAGYRNIKLVYDNGETTFENYYVIRVLDMDISIENNTVISSSTSGFNYNVYGYYDSIEYSFDNQYKGTYDYSGTISFDQGDLIDGNHTIEFKVRTDDGTELSKKITFYVLSLNVTIPNYVQKREDAFIAVKVSDKSPANVTAYLTDSGNPEKIESAQLSDGQANISLNQLSSGYHNIRVVYEGSEFNVTQDVSTTILDISTSIENNTSIMSNTEYLYVNFDAYFAGNIVFKFDDVEKQVYDHVYNIQIPLFDCDLSQGVHTIDLILSWEGGSISKKIVFNTTDVLIEIPQEIAKNYNPQGIPTYATVYLNNDAAGNVTVFADGNQLSYYVVYGYSVYVYLTQLDVGEHDIEIIYSGDGNYPKTVKSEKINVVYVQAIENTYLTYGIDDLRIVLPSTDGVIVKIDGNETDYTIVDSNHILVSKSVLDIGNHNVIVENSNGEMDLGIFNVVANFQFDYQKQSVSLILPEDANGTMHVEIVRYDPNTYEELEVVKTVNVSLVDGKAIFENDLIPDYYIVKASYVNGNYDVSPNSAYMDSQYRYDIDKSIIYSNETASITFMSKENIGKLRVETSHSNKWNEIFVPIVDNKANLTLSGLEYGALSRT